MKNRKIDAIFFLFMAAVLFFISFAHGLSFPTADTGGISGVKILTPVKNESFYGDSINFAGICIGGGGCNGRADYSLSWVSSRDGAIGSSITFSTWNLSVGEHVIEFRVSDAAGRTFADRMRLTIRPVELSAGIESEDPEGFYVEGGEVALSAKAYGGTPPYAYSWRIGNSFVSGVKNVSKSFSAGGYVVELTVRDAAGVEAKSTKGLNIVASSMVQKSSLIVRIESPRGYQVFKESSEIPFSAGIAGGKQPYTCIWTLGSGKVIGVGPKFSATNISGGAHNVTTVQLKVIDSDGATATDSVRILVEPPCVIDGLCRGYENYTNCPEDCEAVGEGYCDGVRDGVCDPDCGRSDDFDCVCNKNSVCEIGIEDYNNCIEDCPQGSLDDYCDKTKDGKCDADCKKGEDPDCSRDYTNYFILLIFVFVIIVVYAKYVRNRIT